MDLKVDPVSVQIQMHNLDGTVRFGHSFRFGSRTGFDPDPVGSVDPDWQSGSGPGREKWLAKSRTFWNCMVLRAEWSHWWIKFYWRLEFMEAEKKYIAVFGQRSSFFSTKDFYKIFWSSKTWIQNLNEKFGNWMQWSGSERLALRTGNCGKTLH